MVCGPDRLYQYLRGNRGLGSDYGESLAVLRRVHDFVGPHDWGFLGAGWPTVLYLL